jgi:hypothetical protein
MPSQKPTLRKKLNKKKKRRLGPLISKVVEYAKLPGIELGFVIRFDSKEEKNEFCAVISRRNIPWLERINDIVSCASYVNQFLTQPGIK